MNSVARVWRRAQRQARQRANSKGAQRAAGSRGVRTSSSAARSAEHPPNSLATSASLHFQLHIHARDVLSVRDLWT
eukprot:4551616-Prymnesium_polylepis.1